ncbi:hypothetical protein [Rhodococcus maanshanensis]|uniref:Uncharacterized protein n=1 Tax=Rhodococcus maanshanensis TaxID=183556 RepID=A0A1H7SXY7_9NOCA|nr:hypothetical protein [Rhodococcus maanshanensis]SEL76397.1 hypothetical protein SAMN05444583_11468 [Rhodococcus maanshanensis]
MRDRAGAVAAICCALALAVLVVVLGLANPPRPTPIATDRLGPDTGEVVAEYLDRAADSVAGSDTDQHWALVSLGPEATVDQAYRLAGGVRISQVLFRVPIERVQTQLIVVDVPGDEAAVRRSPLVAAGRLQGSAGEWDRQARIDAVSAGRLADGCACVVGMTVRGDLAQLRALASRPGVRAVEALPADAVHGRFAVVPLLPEHVDVVRPGPDDGEVPAR